MGVHIVIGELPKKNYKYYDINPIPHFCTFENLYSILNKYSNNKKIKFIGSFEKHYDFDQWFVDTLYFKIGNNFLEVISSLTGYFWVNEVNNVDKLHLYKEDGYYRFFNTKIELKEVSNISTYLIKFLRYSDLKILKITHNKISINMDMGKGMFYDRFIENINYM